MDNRIIAQIAVRRDDDEIATLQQGALDLNLELNEEDLHSWEQFSFDLNQLESAFLGTIGYNVTMKSGATVTLKQTDELKRLFKI